MTQRRYNFEILYEDNHLLVVNKRAGWIVQGAQPGDASLLDETKDYIGEKYNKPGSVYLGVVSRLDREVTGVLPFARTSKAAARLNDQFRDRTVDKIYWALVDGEPPSDQAELRHWLVRDERIGKTLCRKTECEGALESVLTYQVMAKQANQAWLEIRLETGRKHQIRAQLQAIGCSIIGDRKYGSTKKLSDDGIALHCRTIRLNHPTSKERLTWNASLPTSWSTSGLIYLPETNADSSSK